MSIENFENDAKIFATTQIEWELIDGTSEGPNKKQFMLPVGRHELERVKNPSGYEAPWLVLKGTLIGMTEGAWKQWVGWGNEFEIVFEENGEIVTSTNGVKEKSSKKKTRKKN